MARPNLKGLATRNYNPEGRVWSTS